MVDIILIVILLAIIGGNMLIEGIKHRYHPVFSVQYHPDAAPGPHDAAHLFDQFMELMDAWKETKKNA